MTTDSTEAARVSRVTGTLKALSGRIRFTLLQILLSGEMSVGDLSQLAKERKTAVSQQLAILRRCRMVTVRKAGKTRFYSLTSRTHTLVAEICALLGDPA